MNTHDVPTTGTPSKNRQWIFDGRPAGKLTQRVPVARGDGRNRRRCPESPILEEEA
jgi:hypothetical protein